MGLPGGLAAGASRPRVARVVEGVVSGEEEDGLWPPGLAAIRFMGSGVLNWEHLMEAVQKKTAKLRTLSEPLIQKFKGVKTTVEN